VPEWGRYFWSKIAGAKTQSLISTVPRWIMCHVIQNFNSHWHTYREMLNSAQRERERERFIPLSDWISYGNYTTVNSVSLCPAKFQLWRKANWSQGKLAVIWLRIFCLPVLTIQK
jgi:hypothetical protein